MNLIFEKKSNSVKEKIDKEKYIMEGETEKLSYPKPEKHKKNEYILSSDIPSDLEFPSKKEAKTVPVNMKQVQQQGEKGELEFGKKVEFPKDKNITESVDSKIVTKHIPSGEKSKLNFNKKIDLPTEGEPEIETDSKISQKYISEGEKGKLEKSKGEAEYLFKGEKPKSYTLEFEKAKPFQKQFSKEELLKKNAGKSFEEWMKDLKERGVSRKARRRFKHIWKKSLAEGKSEEYAARAAIDSLPKSALENPTAVHGPEKRGPIKSAEYVAIEDIVGFTVASLLKFAKQCPEQFEKLMNSIEIKQYSQVVEASLEKSADISEDIRRKQEEINKLQETLAKLQSELADLQKKQSEQTAQIAK